jgi:hypothetical protein
MGFVQSRHGCLTGVVARAAALALATAGSAAGAQKLIASQNGADLVVGSTQVPVVIDFGAVAEPVTGVGLIGQWTAIVADQENGTRPWSIDMRVFVHSPAGEHVHTWGPALMGDRSIIDYPIQDATETSFATEDGSGAWTFTVASGNPAPYVIGVNTPSWHLLTTVPDVTSSFTFPVTDGPQWMRPYFIGGVSGLGPCYYRVLEFQVETSGLYRFDSTVSSGSAFTFLYRDTFDPAQPLQGLFDYGLGNGNAPNGAPNGTSLIEALLLEGQTYYFVVSQWDRFSMDQTYSCVVTGPGALLDPSDACLGDLDGNGQIDADDLGVLLAAFGSGASGDLNGDGNTDADDLGVMLSLFGSNCE